MEKYETWTRSRLELEYARLEMKNEKMLEALKGIDESLDVILDNLPDGICKSSIQGALLFEPTRIKSLISEIEAGP